MNSRIAMMVTPKGRLRGVSSMFCMVSSNHKQELRMI
jgi:hypothetical protein